RIKRRIETDGHVPAADVEANAGNADLLLVGNNATDRLRVTEMAIGAHDASDDVADRHAIAHLRNRRVVVLAEHLERAVLELGASGFSAAIAFAASAASRAKCSLRAASRNVHQTGVDRWPGRSILPSGSRPALRAISRARSWYGSGRPIALHLAISVCRRNPASAS